MRFLPRFTNQKNPASFQQKEAKQTVRVRSTSGGSKEIVRTAPPVPVPKDAAAQRTAYDNYQAQLSASRNNWGGYEWEVRHDGVGVNFALYGGSTSGPAMGGTQHHQQDQTHQRTYYGPPDAGAGYAQRSVPLPQPPAERLPPPPMTLPQRVAGWFTQPEPRPIIDLRGSGGPLMDPNQYQDPPVTSWPGADNNPPGRTPWPGENSGGRR
jgi:hypothetical protein